jgi:ParB-like chromosome segregation protein Spo0J
MTLQSIDVAQLHPAPYNPRITLQPGDPGWDKLARSLREFDLVQPIVWNRRTGHGVAGHQRLAVLKHSGLTAVDCVVVDLPLAREQALNVTLNNASVGGNWDGEKLVDLLTELEDLPDFDATLTGFDERQLRDLRFVPDPAALDDAESADADIATHLTVTLEVPPDRWTAVEPQLDKLLAQEPTLRLHVQEPMKKAANR